MNRKEARHAKQAAKAAAAAAAPTPATVAPAVEAKPKVAVAKVENPAVAEAKAELARARQVAKDAEAKAKAERKEAREKAAQERAARITAPRPVCTGIKKDGSPCTARSMEGKVTCVDHQPAWDRLTHDEHVAFGKWLREARGPEIVEVIGWFRAKQIAKDRLADAAVTVGATAA